MSSGLKVAILIGSLTEVGASERIALEQALGLRRLGHQVACYAAAMKPRRCYPDFIRAAGARSLAPRIPEWIPEHARIVPQLAGVALMLIAGRFREFDVLVGLDQPGIWLAYWLTRLSGKPYIAYLTRRPDGRPGRPASAQQGGRAWAPSLVQRFLSWGHRRSLEAASTVITNGAALAGYVGEAYGLNPELCPAGCHPQPRRLLRRASNASRGHYFKVGDLEVTKPYLFSATSHEPEGGLEYLVEILEGLAQEVPQVSLVIAGRTSAYTLELMALARAKGLEGRIRFVGQVSEPDLQRLYREAEVYCHTRADDRFGLGILEAMAWGVPVVAWDRAGPADIILDGDTGFLATPFHLNDFAKSVSWLLQDPKLRARMGDAAHDRAGRGFTWDRHARILENAMHRVLGRPSLASLPADIGFAPYQAGSGPLTLSARPVAAHELSEVEADATLAR